MPRMIKLTHQTEDWTILIREDFIAKVEDREGDEPGTLVRCIAHPGEPAWDWFTVSETPEEILALMEEGGDYTVPEDLRGVEAALQAATSTPEGKASVGRALLDAMEIPDCCVVEMFMDLKRRDGSAEDVRELGHEGYAQVALRTLGLESLLEEDSDE